MGERHSNQHQPAQGIQFRQAGRLQPGLKRQRRGRPLRLDCARERFCAICLLLMATVPWMWDLIPWVSGRLNITHLSSRGGWRCSRRCMAETVRLWAPFLAHPCKRRRDKSAPWNSLQPISTFASPLRLRGQGNAAKGKCPDRSQLALGSPLWARVGMPIIQTWVGLERVRFLTWQELPKAYPDLWTKKKSSRQSLPRGFSSGLPDS